MRNPVFVLESLQEKACSTGYQFERLYRNLYNPDFYLLAYKNIAASKGSMTAGADGVTLDGMSMTRINKIIAVLKDHSYQPNPARREYIEKKNSSKKRPLGIQSTDDKLVQEIVRMILESIYEPTFSNYSHGFRPNRSCHTALLQVQRTLKGAKWIVEGDIKACFDCFDHHVLINILRRRIKDEYFIALIWKFLKAGYMEQWTYHKTYSGTPQGSGASPILANIYLSELDAFLEQYSIEFQKRDSVRRTLSREYKDATNRYYKALKELERSKANGDQADITQAVADVKSAQKGKQQTLCHNAVDPSFKTIHFNRYADDFVIGVNGSKSDAEKIKEDIRHFLQNTLRLTLSEEKTKITHSSELIRYLGYDFSVSRSRAVKRNKNGALEIGRAHV
jgi:group II intron reverse transcriptase/maturase